MVKNAHWNLHLFIDVLFCFQNTPEWLNSQHLFINRHPNTQSQLQKAR
jgi:hypothetical protein